MSIGLGTTLLVIHYAPLIVAALFWFNREVARSVGAIIGDLLGLAGILATVFLFPVLSGDQTTGDPTAGHAAGWFIIFSGLSFGVLPLATIALHFFAGRTLGRLARMLSNRMRGPRAN